MTVTRSVFLALLGGLACSVLIGCFDSRWLDEQEEKKHAAARLRPATLNAEGAPRNGSTRTAFVRGYATQAYAAETMNWVLGRTV